MATSTPGAGAKRAAGRKSAPKPKPAPKPAAKPEPTQTPAAEPVEPAQRAGESPVVMQHAPLEAPPKPPARAPEPVPAQAGDGAADLLTAHRSSSIVCERTGLPPEASCLFSEPVDGLVRVGCRVLEHGELGGRTITRLLVGAGTVLSVDGARRIGLAIDDLDRG